MEDQAETLPALLSPEDFRRRMGLSHHRCWRLLASKAIRSFKLEGRRYIPSSEIEEFPQRQLIEQGAV